MSRIKSVSAIEILDSRGRPTLLARCELSDGVVGRASAPSGASTGSAEALELRDRDPARYAGLGCLKAAENVSQHIHRAIAGGDFASQEALDRCLVDLDGTDKKSRLGANAILSVSLAFARAQAAQRGVELYRHFADIAGTAPRLPKPMINLYSGGLHAGRQVAIQDVQIVAPSAAGIRETLAVVSDVFRAAAKGLHENYHMRLLTADEGGLAPPFATSQAMFREAVRAIETAGYAPSDEVALTVDVAASHFYDDGVYHLDGEQLDSANMVDHIDEWRRYFPIVSVEDGLDESDWDGWRRLYERLRGTVMLLGDDLLCTNPVRIRRAIKEKAADSLLLKVNQIGTLTEAAEALRLAREAGWHVVVSARSGETEDDWLADLAVGWAGDYIKVGSITQSERLAKYNRLLELEHYAGLSF
ncbi:MAG: phosphopyruvate hydratase [Chloroflexi bacterium]|nr:phosphopyruvate hydratase [Chloroflexota bacterium]